MAFIPLSLPQVPVPLVDKDGRITQPWRLILTQIVSRLNEVSTEETDTRTLAQNNALLPLNRGFETW